MRSACLVRTRSILNNFSEIGLGVPGPPGPPPLGYASVFISTSTDGGSQAYCFDLLSPKTLYGDFLGKIWGNDSYEPE